MNRGHQGILGEAKVLAYLIEQGYDVFTQFSDNTPFDLVAHKDGELYRVSVKSTSVETETGAWIVQLKSTRINMQQNNIRNFDNTSCDILAVYVAPLDEVVLIDASTITQRSAIQIRI